ncbi:hypothetical protein [Nitrospira sp. Ecomares 2.1]
MDQTAQIHVSHIKIGQLSVGRDSLVNVFNRLGLGGNKNWLSHLIFI